MVNTVLEYFRSNLLRKGVDLSEPLGVNNFAWYFKDALQVINWCGQNDIAVVGGDVIERLETGKLSYTYDNWYMDSDASAKRAEFVIKSIEFANQKITFFKQIHSSKTLLFELVFNQ
ncbi:MAG: hypothetical protein H6656_12465 [Ardenticatenaceae bacterium]|nr:hypothetical protein [Ardenticatenaceae bacterium]